VSAPVEPRPPARLWRRAAAGTLDALIQTVASEALTRVTGARRPEARGFPPRWALRRRRRPLRRQFREALFGATPAEIRAYRRYSSVNALGTLSTALPAVAQGGRTPGQRALGLRLVREDDSETSVARSLVRGVLPSTLVYGGLLARSPAAVAAVALAAWADGLAVLGPGRRTLRDRALGTRMVEDP
jgi:hypothetical protein